jgi:hypothetical protein
VAGAGVRKIPSLFQREAAARGRESLIIDKVTPGCEWVSDSRDWTGSRKWDGTAVLVLCGVLYARYDAKKGKAPPPGALPCQDPDPITGHWPHWVLADRPEDKWIREASGLTFHRPDGTYEAIGPKINGNPERLTDHVLVPHGAAELLPIDVSFVGLREFLSHVAWEGVVFKHHDGRMCKVKRKDYGLPWPVQVAS